ncbi:unnamed protein product [Cladocopium goreaui]|uniref:Retrovirus-related Pol polyprotein from transposon RE1 (Retro element 1) (AtRE1) n=1 Tax=Cladocopium goreaui TaxID=2562237 RepID=A0A9P1CCJ2_9DINO|nr:unnamed protein product [Cladocopium goreaui]
MAVPTSEPMGAMGLLDGSEHFAPSTPPSVTGEDLVREEDIPMPSFGDATRRRARRLRFQDSAESVGGASDVGASSSGGSYGANGGWGMMEEGFREQHGSLDGGLLRGTGEGNMSPMQDPWMENDPWSGRQQHWQVNAAENWSDLTSDRHSASGSDYGSSWSWSSSRWSAREWEQWQNWDTSSSASQDDQSEEGKYSNWTWRSSTGYDDPWRKWSNSGELLDGRALPRDDHGQEHRLEECERPDQRPQGDEGTGATPLSPTSPQAQRLKDKDNRPMREIPSGVPSVAGNNSQQQAPGVSGKISSSYPPIFNARPGESWEQYWRSVTFWVASEGKSLPAEMQGPRLMQQLRERAAKIVQHLTVSDVSGSDGIQKIKEVMERSPIIKLLDQKKIDQRRQKFMRLARLSGESIESFLNRAEIYRRENQTSPAYQVGSKFYIGHLLDAAKLTKRDLALIKAASGGSLEEEDAVTTSLMDLSEQLEGQAGCPIGKGEPTLDQEDKYLVQKATSSSMASPLQSATQSSSGGPGGRRGNRRRFFGRRRFRDALLAILEDEEAMEEPAEEDNFMAEIMGEESMDDDEDDITSFGGSTATPTLEASNTSTTTSTTSSSASSLPDFSMAEIYAQEYKARNRVKEIKKMRQYFQREAGGQPQGGRDREQVKQWVREQQKTEPCFICRQLGHWSQECPYRNKAPIHATNVTFPSAGVSEANWALLQHCAQSDAKYKGAPQGDISLEELAPPPPAGRSVRRRASRTLSETRRRSGSPPPEINQNMLDLQAQMNQMAAMMMQLQETAATAKAKAKGKPGESGQSTTRAKGNKENKRAALTGREADFPTLSNRYSYDLTFNILGSLTEQTLTFKWKMMLLQLRVKKAVEADKAARRKWKKNPRWVLHMHGRFLASLWGHIGSARQLCFNPKIYHLGYPEEDRERIEGLMMPPAQQRQLFREGIEELHQRGDLSEELRQSGDLPEELLQSGDLLEEPQQSGDLPEELHQSGDLPEEPHPSGDLPEEPYQEKEVLHGEAQSQGGKKRITLNRRQTRSIRQGVQKALKVQQRIYAAAHMKQRPWVLLEVFAGKATLSSMANESTKWEVLPPQDVLYGLDLKDEQHQQWLKDVIETQRPDVVVLSPPCGPWSSWQRMRKRRDLLEALRREHQPFWDLVCWIWAFQTAHGGLAVLEQPKQSDALRMPKMTQRKQVYEKEVHMCQMGLVDRVSGDPHKKSTAVQMNHPVILTEVFPERKCDHPPGAHQPIEGHVRIWDEQQRRYRQVRRSTLAAEWTPEFCGWLLDGLEAVQEEAAQTFHLELHREVPITKIWEAVPVELEPTPEGQLRQHLQQQEHGTRYDYISFSGDAAMVNKTMRSTLAHLHVALGHVTNDKLKRMMLLNGAKPELASIIDHLECQICKQVRSPMATPKAAFQRPMQFNERIVADSFYIWDSENTKYAVTHVLDTFSLYQIAVAAQDPSSEGTTALLRDRWIGVFGPPAVLMTDQGSEFHGQLEPLLTTFGTFHEMVPPTAHWRMSLAERHGAVLKVLLMKIIKEQSIIGLQQLQMAVVAATAARNSQARIAGYSPTQLVFGRDTTLPTNMMEALAGHFQFQLARPTSPEESFFRANQIRKAASEAFQWMEASEALKKAAGSRARLPKLELLMEGSQVMFWEPPAHRRGMSRRLQDDVSWFGPAVVAAIERKDGAIKRVWVRYKNKLKGLPLEFVRMAVAEEHEAAAIAKEALEDLAKQLEQGRVNAEVPEEESSSSSSSLETEQRKMKKKKALSAKVTFRPERKGSPPDPRYPMVEFSDEEDEGKDPVSADRVRSSASALDDVPMSILTRGSTAATSSRPSKKARTKEGERADPSTRPFVERRGYFDKAMKKTEQHFKEMKQKLEPKTVQVAVPTQDDNPEMIDIQVRNDEPPYINLERFKNTEYSDSDAEFGDAKTPSLPVMDEDGQLGMSILKNENEPVLYRRTAYNRYSIEYHPASPLTRTRLPPPPGKVMHQIPEQLRRPLTATQQLEVVARQREDPAPQRDYWMISPDRSELYRVHVVPRFHLFDCLAYHQEESDHQPYLLRMPGGVNREWITGARATQVYYVNNPLEPRNYLGIGPLPQSAMFMHPTVSQMRMSEFIVDNLKWHGWNTQQHLLGYWQGITRYQLQDPEETESHLVHWLEARHFAEEAWRSGQHLMEEYRGMQKEMGWPNETLMATRVGPLQEQDTQEAIESFKVAKDSMLTVQNEMLETFFNYIEATNIRRPEPRSPYSGQLELTHLPEDKIDTTVPETGKVRLELKWSDLSAVWQKAFEQPIKDALDIYFKHDALAPVFPGETVDDSEILPSRFVLVNKSDPRNNHPKDADLPDAKLKARLVIAGHKDQRAGDFETESPTASLLAHNLLCFLAAQWGWKMSFSDIASAFLQGDYLPSERRVFVRCPTNYPMFVRQFLTQQLPPGARTDLMRMKKAGFGLAESPRLWYKKFKRGTESIGGREMQLCPGVFSFFQGGRLIALLAVHVDDVRLIAEPEKEKEVTERLNSLFTFGDWNRPTDWTKFCGRFEKQLEDGTVLVQMDNYSERLSDSPQRTRGEAHPLLPNERKWIGTICGQLNWMARQCRADLAFGVSRVQQLAGVADPAALTELRVLVERARMPVTVKFTALGCDIKDMVVIYTSDASFAGMPRGRSGGFAVGFANPEILAGSAPINVVHYHSGLLKRVVRSSLAAEISQAAHTLEEGDFIRALLAEMIYEGFSLKMWLTHVARWKLVLVLDSRTGYDLLNGTGLGEDKRLAIDIAAMRQSLHEDGAARLVRWVPGEEIIADDLTKLCGNQKLMTVLSTSRWALKDTEVAKRLRADAAARKRTYRQKVSADRNAAESSRQR